MKYPGYKAKYLIFILTIIVTIIAKELVLRYSLNVQDADAQTINIAGRQRMLSQKIVKHMLFLDNDTYSKKEQHSNQDLENIIDEFQEAHNFLIARNQVNYDEVRINSLFEDLNPVVNSIIRSSRSAVNTSSSNAMLTKSINSILPLESTFLTQMEVIVKAYQNIAERHLATTKNVGLVLSIISILILLAEFIFIIGPLLKKLFRQNRSLAISNGKLSDFAHIASHNLRAPINNVNTLLSFYKKSNDTKDKEELMEKLEITMHNLNDTMNTLIDSLKTTSETQQPLETVHFEDILKKTTASISTQVYEANAKIQSNFANVPKIMYNPLYLESIFLNLLTNSIKYKSPDRTPAIDIRTVRKNGKTQLLFQDNGLGIDMKRNGDKLFGMNKTFHKHPNAKGVGLFMTRNQIESLGGTIMANSSVDEGTLFTVTF